MNRPGLGRHALPGRLPPGEHILWQGAPHWRALARNALHLRGLALYLALLAAAVCVSGVSHGETAHVIAIDTLRAALAASLPVALGLIYAWAVARTTTYTITSKRVVLRMGIALPMTVNLPFALVEGAGLHKQRDGTGDVGLVLNDSGRKLSWLLLWPHARSWRFFKTEPLLRALPDAERAGQILSRALAADAGTQLPMAPASRVVDSGQRNHGVTTVAA